MKCVFLCCREKGGHGHGDKKKEYPPHYFSYSQSANTKHRGKEKKGNYNRQEEERQQFWQSCVDNFPRADLVKEATSVELQPQPLGCSGSFCSDVLQSTFFFYVHSNLVCSACCKDSDLKPRSPSAPQLRHCDGYECVFNWQKQILQMQTQTHTESDRHIVSAFLSPFFHTLCLSLSEVCSK